MGFTDIGLLRISESVRAYAYLILSSQASARSSIVGNMASALTAQSAFLNNFEDIVNRRVNIPEDIIFLLTGFRIYRGEYKAQGPTLCPTEGRALRGPRALYSPV